MITENGLLYLFTTIAQCLAAIIALLAAFGFYQLQSMEKSVADACDYLIASFKHSSVAWEHTAQKLSLLRAQGKFAEFIAFRAAEADRYEVTPHERKKLPDGSESENQIVLLQNATREMAAIRAALRVALLTSGLVMTGVITLTPLAYAISCSLPLAAIVSVTSIAAFGFCLWKDNLLIKASLSAPESLDGSTRQQRGQSK